MSKNKKTGRRSFLKKSSLGASLLVTRPLVVTREEGELDQHLPDSSLYASRELNLAPARWIWYPSGRVLQNTVVLFRRRLYLNERPVSATGWILGDSRYRLFVNGKRIQWGPAPSDPRWAEADPIDLQEHLTEGTNILGAEVLYFGQGDGTWPIGKAGFVFLMEIVFANGDRDVIVSDERWKTHLARSWKPGQYKRWYLRAFQEEFDARLYPYGWMDPAFQPDANWLDAMDLQGAPNEPALSTGGRDYLHESTGDPAVTQLRKRSVPMLQESITREVVLSENSRIAWHRPPEEYFESLTPNSYSAQGLGGARQNGPGRWTVTLDGTHGVTMTFELPEQIVGWPFFSITAPEGTVVELMVHEAHKVGGPALLNTRFHSWSRFICREGRNDFETFDFESLRWIQLHIHNVRGAVQVENVGVRRRMYPWPQLPAFSCSDERVENVWNAAVNTLHNCAQDTIVDCMGRERQQYSGDIGHTIHGIYHAFGESRQIGRYVDTFGQGITQAGYFLDCWPAYDRLARLPQRELQLTPWGPLIDHGIGHVFDAYYYYMYTGDLTALEEVYPRLLRFFVYLRSLRGDNGLLPVQNLGVPTVWIDSEAYQQQHHKLCVFNMYAAAMMQHALAPLCRAHGQEANAVEIESLGNELQEAVVGYFWSRREGAFIINQPWLQDESPRYCDRSLATGILYNMCPGGRTEESVRLLVDMPESVGMSYPANAGWRLRGLAEAGRGDVVVTEIQNRWGAMRSVHENNTLSEGWEPTYDTRDQWSHASVAPLYMLYMGLMGLRPVAPGYETYTLRPQFGNLENVSATAHTALGPIAVHATGAPGNRRVRILVPERGQGYLIVPSNEAVTLERHQGFGGQRLHHYVLPAGHTVEVSLRYI